MEINNAPISVAEHNLEDETKISGKI